MGLDITLSYIVTVLGFLLCIFSMVFIFLGKKTVGEHGSQLIRFKQLEVKTNSVLMLFMVSASVAALPLLLLHYRPIPNCPAVSAAPTPEKRPLYITGYVQKPDGSPLQGAVVLFSILSQDGSSQEIDKQIAQSDGAFAMSHPIGPGDRLRVIATKEGYVNQTLMLGIDSLTYPTVLVKSR